MQNFFPDYWWHVRSIFIAFGLFAISNSIPLHAQDASESAAALLQAGTDCFDDEEFPLAIELISQSIAASKNDKDIATEAKGHYHLAVSEFWMSKYESSNANLYLLLNEFTNLLTREDSLRIIRQVSQNHYYMGNYEMAHELALERLKLTEKLKDSFNIAISYQVLGEIECRQKDYDNALKSVQISYNMMEKMEVVEKADELSFNLDLMGDIFHQTGRFEEALTHKIKACQIIDTTISSYDNAYCNHTIALTLSKMGRYDIAIPLFKTALARWVKMGMPEETAMTRACLGEAIAWSGQCGQGIPGIQEAMREAETISMGPLRRDILDKLYQTSKHCGQIEAAFKYLEKYILVNDSLNDQNTKVRIASLSNNYQLEKKNAELEVMKQAEKVKVQYIMLLSAGLLLLMCLAGFIYFTLKKQRKYSQLLDAKSKQIAQQYDDINCTNEKLMLANKELEQFAYLASHDLKTPLRTIGNYSSLITRRYSSQLDKDGLAFLAFITEAAKHMNALLEDIFAYSKVGKGNAERTEVNMQEKLDLALRLLHETIESKNAEIQYDPLPVVVGNSTQLYQVIQNLLDNALKFIPEGRQPKLQIRLTEEGDFYQFSLSDNGIGIAENKREEVFTIFKRLHSREAYIGTGIGLAICKKIVEGHGGQIWIESDGEKGSTFHFTLKKSIRKPKNSTESILEESIQSVIA